MILYNIFIEFQRSTSVNGLRIVILIINTLRLISEVYQLYYHHIKEYIKDWKNWFEAALIIVT